MITHCHWQHKIHRWIAVYRHDSPMSANNVSIGCYYSNFWDLALYWAISIGTHKYCYKTAATNSCLTPKLGINSSMLRLWAGVFLISWWLHQYRVPIIVQLKIKNMLRACHHFQRSLNASRWIKTSRFLLQGYATIRVHAITCASIFETSSMFDLHTLFSTMRIVWCCN